MKSKKILSLLIALAMVVSLAVPAFAISELPKYVMIDDGKGNVITFDADDLVGLYADPAIKAEYAKWLNAPGVSIYVSYDSAEYAGVIIPITFNPAAGTVAQQLVNAEKGDDISADLAADGKTILYVDSVTDGDLVVKETPDGEPVGTIGDDGILTPVEPGGPGDEEPELVTISGIVTVPDLSATTITFTNAAKPTDTKTVDVAAATGAYTVELTDEATYDVETDYGIDNVDDVITVDPDTYTVAGAATNANFTIVVESEDDVDTTAYAALVSEAEQAETDKDDYTDPSWTAYETAIALCNLELTAADGQAKIDAEVTKIQEALALLVLIADVDTTAYDEIVAENDALVEDDYTAESWALYLAAIGECDLTLTAAAGQAAINEEVTRIRAAIDELEALPTTVTKVEVKDATTIWVFMEYPGLLKGAFEVALTSSPSTKITISTSSDKDDENGKYYELTLASGMTMNTPYTLTVSVADSDDQTFSIEYRQLGTIRGTVHAKQADDSSTAAAALAGATVTVKNAGGETVAETETIHDGTYETIALPTGTYSVVISYEGYKDATVPATFATDAGVDVNAITPPFHTALLSQATLLYSNDTAIATIDFAEGKVYVADTTTADALAAELHVKHNGENFTISRTAGGFDISGDATEMQDGWFVKAQAEDPSISKLYEVVIADASTLLADAISRVTLATPSTTADNVTLVGVTAAMRFQKVAFNASFSTDSAAGYKMTASGGVEDIAAIAGDKIAVYVNGASYSNNPEAPNQKVFTVGYEHIGKAGSPTFTLGSEFTLKQGTLPNTATVTVNANNPTWQYQIAADSGLLTEEGWVNFPATGSPTGLVDVPAELGDKIFVRVMQNAATGFGTTNGLPASEATAGDKLVVRAGDLSCNIAAAASTSTGTVVTGLTAGTEPATKFAYRISPTSYTNIIQPKGTAITINSSNYTVISNLALPITATAGNTGKYLVIVEVDATSNEIINWTQFLLSSENVRDALPAVSTVTLTNASSGTAAEKALMTNISASLGAATNKLLVSKTTMTAIPEDLLAGIDFYDYDDIANFDLIANSSSVDEDHKFNDGLGKYLFVETDVDFNVLGASLKELEAEHITYVVRVTDNRYGASLDGLTINTDFVGGITATIDASSRTSALDSVNLPGYTYFEVESDSAYLLPSYKIGNDSSDFADSTATLTLTAPEQQNGIIDLVITTGPLWQFRFEGSSNAGATYTVKDTSTGATEVQWVENDLTYGPHIVLNSSDKYAVPENESIANTIKNLKDTDTFAVAADGLLSEIAVVNDSPNTIRAIKINDDECDDELKLTGVADAADTLMITSGDVFDSFEIDLAGGFIDISNMPNLAPTSITTSAASTVNATTGHVFTVDTSAPLTVAGVTVNGAGTAATVTMTDGDKMTVTTAHENNTITIADTSDIEELAVGGAVAATVTNERSAGLKIVLESDVDGLQIKSDENTIVDARALAAAGAATVVISGNSNKIGNAASGKTITVITDVVGTDVNNSETKIAYTSSVNKPFGDTWTIEASADDAGNKFKTSYESISGTNYQTIIITDTNDTATTVTVKNITT